MNVGAARPVFGLTEATMSEEAIQEVMRLADDDPDPDRAAFGVGRSHQGNPVQPAEPLLQAIADAAYGLSFGEDWNNGTHAKAYRKKLIAAVKAYRAHLPVQPTEP